MGNCLVLLGLKKLKRNVTLLLVGLDNAGKTTAAKGIIGDPVEDVAPTVGFAPENLEYRGCDVTIYDLGGGTKIRPVWQQYFSEIHGVIFVVDSSTPARIKECRDVLTGLLSHKKISGKPALILCNKQDIEGAMDEIDLVESLNIEAIVNKFKCPTRVETCSAITTTKNKPDKPIADGFRWLVDTIVVHYTDINKRVQQDLEREKEQRKKELIERRERIQTLREERERLELLRHGGASVTTGRTLSNVVGDDGSDEGEGTKDLQTNNAHTNAGEPSSAEINSERPLSSCAQDNEELKELGFTSPQELNSRSSSSSETSLPEKETKESQSPVADASITHPAPRMIMVQGSSPVELDETPNASLPPINPDINKAKYEISMNGSAVSVKASPKVDLSYSRRDDECVPIDSDDELFDLADRSPSDNAGRRNSGASRATNFSVSNSSIFSYVKEQLDLESSDKAPKKKSFLKRYHKTAPLVMQQNGEAVGNGTSHLAPSLA